MKPLVITENAIRTLSSRGLRPEWLLEPFESSDIEPVRVHSRDYGVYVLQENCSINSPCMIINRTEDGFFGGVPSDDRHPVYDRCARLALHCLNDRVSINNRWMPYHSDKLVSIFAYGDTARHDRIVALSNPRERQDAYVFALSDLNQVYKLESLTVDLDPYDLAISDLEEAIEFVKANPKIAQQKGVVNLDDVIPGNFAKNICFSDWYGRFLSKQQKQLVDMPFDGPIRVKGAAGTGKTLALAVKALKLAYEAHESQTPCRILFTTASWAGTELIDKVLRRIDEKSIMDGDKTVVIDVFPLLTLAEGRDYSKIGRKPLGIDSNDGKMKSIELIDKILKRFLSSDWLAYRGGCAEKFVERLSCENNSKEFRNLCWDLLVEFGCVLAAQGNLGHESHKIEYLRIKRARWMLPLENKDEKTVVFELWKRFLITLRQENLIATDQIISDYLNDLSTFYWEAARRVRGYDYVFVDEMHLFNAQERLIFHNLLADPDQTPRVIMAMDPQQSPREVFVQVISDDKKSVGNIYERAKLPNPNSVDLVEVYRYTPEIDAVIKSIHEIVPALDLPDDWDIPAGHSSIDGGELPFIYLRENDRDVFQFFCKMAIEQNREARKNDGQAAILCMDQEKFTVYASAAAGQYAKEIITISSRDESDRLRYAATKIVLSMPEYVAGLQFDTVVIVDANKNLIPEALNFGHHLRRFLSELYLGISRAERTLNFVCSKDAGGPAEALTRALERGLIRAAEPS